MVSNKFKMVDVAISFDMTGSMSPCIHQVRVELDRLIQNVVGSLGDVRIAIITHGDYDSNRYLTRYMDFTSDVEGMRAYIKSVEDAGLNSYNDGEAYEEALHIATQLNWRVATAGEIPLTKILIVIGDDIPHSPDFPSSKNRYNWQDEIARLRSEGIITYGVQAPTLSETRSRDFYSALMPTPGSEPIKLRQFANIVDIITAAVFAPRGEVALRDLENNLIAANRYNRNMEQVFNNLIGREDERRCAVDPPPAYSAVFSSTASPAYSPSDLIEVHPSRFQVLTVDVDSSIKAFVTSAGAAFKTGSGFYELTKSESISDKKEVVLQHVMSGTFYTGDEARSRLGLGPTGTKKIAPRNVPAGYKAFVQSTSVNRKLIGGTSFLYEMSAN